MYSQFLSLEALWVFLANLFIKIWVPILVQSQKQPVLSPENSSLIPFWKANLNMQMLR